MQVYAAPEEIPLPAFGDYFGAGRHDYNGYQAAEEAYITAVQKWALEHGDPHELAGKFIHVPYADGAAQYVTFKRGTRFSLIHLAIGDGWQDPRFERLCTTAEIRRIVEADERRAAFFAQREAEKQEAKDRG